MWEPWVGDSYKTSRLLLLGESCYVWEAPKGSGILNAPQPDQPVQSVNWSIEDPAGQSATMDKLTRAVSNTASPTSAQAAEGWSRVAFTNYVPISAGVGARTRPSEAGCKQAKDEWPALLERLSPRVIVLGLTMWNRRPETQTVQSPLVQGYRLVDGSTALCRATRHPSWGPGWSSYAAMVTSALEEGAVGDTGGLLERTRSTHPVV